MSDTDTPDAALVTSEADAFLQKLSTAELTQHIQAAEALLRTKREQAKSTLRAKLEELVADAGLTLDEAMTVIRPKAQQRRKPRSDKGAPRTAKYQHPTDPSKTWSGKGRVPAWMKGANKEQFAVDRPEAAEPRHEPSVAAA